MQKADLINLIKTKSYNKAQLLSWVESLPNVGLKIKPISYKQGDVFFNYSLNHPMIVFKKRGDSYICGLLTSSIDCNSILEKCESRFFPESYFTQTLTIQYNIEEYPFMGVYDNFKHLRSIYTQLKQLI